MLFELKRKFGRISGVLLVFVAVAALASGTSSAANNSGGLPTTNPNTPIPKPLPSYPQIVELAQRELSRNVQERKGNNIPRYRKGKGRIAPYSIKDAWCAAFSTWAWRKAGFRDYLGASVLWKAFGGAIVAVQVRDLTNWAKRTGHFSTRAKPGYLVAYGNTHIGVVEEADREGRAVMSIEGNARDAVSEVIIDMDNVTGYISPEVLTPSQVIKMRMLHPDM